jgi:hypothetical protein
MAARLTPQRSRDIGLVSETQAATLSASAKVNLALHVTGRRPDGYHLLDSIAVFTDLADSGGNRSGGSF